MSIVVQELIPIYGLVALIWFFGYRWIIKISRKVGLPIITIHFSTYLYFQYGYWLTEIQTEYNDMTGHASLVGWVIIFNSLIYTAILFITITIIHFIVKR